MKYESKIAIDRFFKTYHSFLVEEAPPKINMSGDETYGYYCRGLHTDSVRRLVAFADGNNLQYSIQAEGDRNVVRFSDIQ